jgi:hypothetical protein
MRSMGEGHPRPLLTSRVWPNRTCPSPTFGGSPPRTGEDL